MSNGAITGGRCNWMPAAPPTKRQFVIVVSMMIASAMVAIEKKMPRMRKVSRPTPNPSKPPIPAATRICAPSGASNALISSTAV